MLDMDSKNAHTLCSKERLEEQLGLNVAYHYMLESFRALYGKTVTVSVALRKRTGQTSHKLPYVMRGP